MLIRNEIDHQSSWSQDIHQQFLKACEKYIGELQRGGHLKIAQPLVREGSPVSGSKENGMKLRLTKGKKCSVGYYHLPANDIELAKGNPEFVFSTTARIEVRPIKVKKKLQGLFTLNDYCKYYIELKKIQIVQNSDLSNLRHATEIKKAAWTSSLFF